MHTHSTKGCLSTEVRGGEREMAILRLDQQNPEQGRSSRLGDPLTRFSSITGLKSIRIDVEIDGRELVYFQPKTFCVSEWSDTGVSSQFHTHWSGLELLRTAQKEKGG